MVQYTNARTQWQGLNNTRSYRTENIRDEFISNERIVEEGNNTKFNTEATASSVILAWSVYLTIHIDNFLRVLCQSNRNAHQHAHFT